MPAWTQEPGYRIATAQFALLQKLDPAFSEYIELDHWAVRNVALDFRSWEATTAEWITVMNALGSLVRKVRKP